MSRTTAFVVAAVLVVLGILAFPLQNLGEPKAECAAKGAPSSGFVDDDSGCPITQESYDEIREYESAPKPWRIAGLVLILGGLGLAGYAVIRKRQRPEAEPEPDPGPRSEPPPAPVQAWVRIML